MVGTDPGFFTEGFATTTHSASTFGVPAERRVGVRGRGRNVRTSSESLCRFTAGEIELNIHILWLKPVCAAPVTSGRVQPQDSRASWLGRWDPAKNRRTGHIV